MEGINGSQPQDMKANGIIKLTKMREGVMQSLAWIP